MVKKIVEEFVLKPWLVEVHGKENAQMRLRNEQQKAAEAANIAAVPDGAPTVEVFFVIAEGSAGQARVVRVLLPLHFS